MSTSTMRANILKGIGDVSVQEVPRPQLEPDQVLVRVAAVGVCGSDVHYFHEGRIGSFVVDSPLILGHEASGEIVEVGADVDPARVGERVSIEPQRPCRRCEYCKSGAYNLCTSMEFYATPPIDGAFAEFVAIQADFAHRIPETMSLEAAALCEPLSVAIWSNRKAATAPGSRVLVTGAGPVGILTAQVARVFGAAEVVVSDVAEKRREQALRFGATRVVDPLTEDVAEGGEFDVYIDASGAPAAVRAGILALAPLGRAVLVGMGPDDVSLPVSRIQSRELLVTGVFRYANTWPLAIELASTGQVDLDGLVTGRFGLDEVESALTASTTPEHLKVVVTPQS